MTEDMVFGCFQKAVSEGADVTFCGRVFHSRKTLYKMPY